MVRNMRFLPVLLFATLLTSPSLYAQGGRGGGPGGPGMQGRMKAQIDEVIEKLALSEEKSKTVRGILEGEMEERMTIFQGFAGNQGGNSRQMMREEMDALQKKTTEKLAEVLSEEEMKKYEEIQTEMQERRRGQFGGGRGQPRSN